MSDTEKVSEDTEQTTAGEEQEEEKVSKASEPSDRVKEVLDLVKQLTVLDLADLVKALEDAFGVSAAAPVAMMAAAQAPAAAAEAEEKSTFDVVLTKVGDSRVPVIKAIRVATSLSLREAKELVDKGPGVVIRSEVAKEEAEALKGQLEEAGATVELT